MTTAKDLMTSPAECLAPEETVEQAARMFSKYDVGSMPVVDGEKLVGVLTDRDIVIECVAKGNDCSSTKVSDIATSNVVTVTVDDQAADVARVLSDNQIRRVPVVDEQGKVVGVIAQADVALKMGEDTTGEVVEEISRD